MQAEPNGGLRQRGSVAGVALVCILLGALIGAMIALPIANNARHRNAYPRALMTLMQHDLDQLQVQAESEHCDDSAVARRLARMHGLSSDSPAAFNASADQDFLNYNQHLIEQLSDSEQNPSCAELKARVQNIDDRCEACHVDYR